MRKVQEESTLLTWAFSLPKKFPRPFLLQTWSIQKVSTTNTDGKLMKVFNHQTYVINANRIHCSAIRQSLCSFGTYKATNSQKWHNCPKDTYIDGKFWPLLEDKKNVEESNNILFLRFIHVAPQGNMKERAASGHSLSIVTLFSFSKSWPKCDSKQKIQGNCFETRNHVW